MAEVLMTDVEKVYADGTRAVTSSSTCGSTTATCW